MIPFLHLHPAWANPSNYNDPERGLSLFLFLLYGFCGESKKRKSCKRPSPERLLKNFVQDSLLPPSFPMLEKFFCTGEIWGPWGSEKALIKGPMYKQQAPQLPSKNVPGKMCHKSSGSCWHAGADVIYTIMLISRPAASHWLRLSPVALHSEEPKYHSIWHI